MRLAPIVPVLSATTAAQALVSLAMLIPAALAPALAADLDVPGRLIGWWISIGYGGGMATSLVAGALVPRLGAARTTQAALLLVALGLGAVALARLPTVALGAVLVGLGYGLTNPAASHLLARVVTPANHNLVYSIKQTGVPLGGTLAGLTAPLVAMLWGWPAAMLLAAGLALALAVMIQPARATWDADRDPRARLRASPLAGLAEIWRDRLLRALSLTGFAYAALQLSLSTFMVTMLVSDLEWTLVEAGLLLSTAQVAGVVGRIGFGALADRMASGMATLAGIGAASAIFAIATYWLSPAWPPVLVFALMVPFSALSLGWNGVYLAQVSHAVPKAQIPRAIGASLFFTYGGVLVGPPVFAALHEVVGTYTATYALAAIPALAGVVLMGMAARARATI